MLDRAASSLFVEREVPGSSCVLQTMRLLFGAIFVRPTTRGFGVASSQNGSCLYSHGNLLVTDSDCHLTHMLLEIGSS